MSRYRSSPLSVAIPIPSTPPPSSASANIGVLLSSPFDSDYDSEDEISTPGRTYTPVTRGAVRYSTPRRDQSSTRIKSLEGVFDDHDEYSEIIEFTSPTSTPPTYPSPTRPGLLETPTYPSPRSGLLETPTFPSPRSGLLETPTHPSPRSDLLETLTFPSPLSGLRDPQTYSSRRSDLQGQSTYESPTHRDQPTRPRIITHVSSTPFHLPAPSSPISPFLAAPPQARIHPFSPPSRTSVTSLSESIRGYEALVEKRALFRGGEEEIAPRPTGRRTIPTAGVKSAKGMDFWSRMSMVVGVSLDEKTAAESEWLVEDQNRKRTLKRGILVAFILTSVIAGIIVIAIVVRSRT